MEEEIKFLKFINTSYTIKTGSSTERLRWIANRGRYDPLNEIFDISKENLE